MKASEILENALALIDKPAGGEKTSWVKGMLAAIRAEEVFARETFQEEQANCFCALGAVARAYYVEHKDMKLNDDMYLGGIEDVPEVKKALSYLATAVGHVLESKNVKINIPVYLSAALDKYERIIFNFNDSTSTSFEDVKKAFTLAIENAKQKED